MLSPNFLNKIIVSGPIIRLHHHNISVKPFEFSFKTTIKSFHIISLSFNKFKLISLIWFFFLIPPPSCLAREMWIQMNLNSTNTWENNLKGIYFLPRKILDFIYFYFILFYFFVMMSLHSHTTLTPRFHLSGIIISLPKNYFIKKKTYYFCNA